MKTKEEIIEALDVLQREAEPGEARAAIITALQKLGTAVESDYQGATGHFEILTGRPDGLSNYRVKRASNIRPLTKAEWPEVAGCVVVGQHGSYFAPMNFDPALAERHAAAREMCYPPGHPGQVRPMWVEVAS